MRIKQFSIGLTVLTGLMVAAGCSTNPIAPDVTDNVRKSLDQAGLKDVSVKQDRDKGVVTLDGHVANDNDKARAESIAKSVAGNQVVADEIAVTPPGVEHDAKTVNSDIDKGIDKNLDAALIQHGIRDGVKHEVKNGVVTLTGNVNSQSKREELTRVASSVPYVQQVVNELEVKNQRATSSNRSY
jgi:osmotically-inducible protein OsmY